MYELNWNEDIEKYSEERFLKSSNKKNCGLMKKANIPCNETDCVEDSFCGIHIPLSAYLESIEGNRQNMINLFKLCLSIGQIEAILSISNKSSKAPMGARNLLIENAVDTIMGKSATIEGTEFLKNVNMYIQNLSKNKQTNLQNLVRVFHVIVNKVITEEDKSEFSSSCDSQITANTADFVPEP